MSWSNRIPQRLDECNEELQEEGELTTTLLAYRAAYDIANKCEERGIQYSAAAFVEERGGVSLVWQPGGMLERKVRVSIKIDPDGHVGLVYVTGPEETVAHTVASEDEAITLALRTLYPEEVPADEP